MIKLILHACLHSQITMHTVVNPFTAKPVTTMQCTLQHDGYIHIILVIHW